MALLSDGLFHGAEEVVRCLNDEQQDFRQLSWWIPRLRKKLACEGKYIARETKNRYPKFRLVLLIDNATD